VKKIIGLIIILFGMLLLLSNLDIVSFEDLSGIVFSSAIIVIGLAGLIEKRRFDFILIMFVIFGGLYLLANLGLVNESMIDAILGPVFLMVVGLSLLLSVTKRVTTKPVSSYVAIFSGIEDKNESKEYVSSDITAIFGGAELDFRKIKIKDKVGYINATAMFGGITIMVPEDVKVTVKGYPIFGGAENKAESNIDAKTELVINYTAMFGGVEIKN
jgi:predicted membrane protein